ncbi:hypothetical protein E4U32_006016 [Claviceps aff. humidiphila group G2b]|nr:hypothetical protein E4U32_006016 [Claviceps aff. humidiphila group G2b]
MSSYEDTHVHAVYEAIAPHFSATRHSPWPFVKSFLLAQPPASIGLDIGCGNGKYLAVNPALHILASDRSPSLVALAKQQHGAREHKDKPKNTTDDTTSDSTNAATAALLTADSLSLPFRPHSADFIICIAVIHHFSSVERRRAAIEALLGCLRRDTGRALIYVWALEQGTSRRGWHEGCEQDTLVPWVMKRKKNKAGRQTRKVNKKDSNGANEAVAADEPPSAPEDGQDDQDQQGGQGGQAEQTYHRYYHLYRQGELEEDTRHAGGEVCESGYERDNWWAIIKTGGGGGGGGGSSSSGQADRQDKDRQGE